MIDHESMDEDQPVFVELHITDPRGESCEECEQQIYVGAVIKWDCPSCVRQHALHPKCLAPAGIDIDPGYAFIVYARVRAVTAKQN